MRMGISRPFTSWQKGEKYRKNAYRGKEYSQATAKEEGRHYGRTYTAGMPSTFDEHNYLNGDLGGPIHRSTERSVDRRGATQGHTLSPNDKRGNNGSGFNNNFYVHICCETKVKSCGSTLKSRGTREVLPCIRSAKSESRGEGEEGGKTRHPLEDLQ